jgi:hypothetical protein
MGVDYKSTTNNHQHFTNNRGTCAPHSFMATTAFRIVSHYEPEQRHDTPTESEQDTLWRAGPSFSRRYDKPPKFVASSAGIRDEGESLPIVPATAAPVSNLDSGPPSLADWYKSLERRPDSPRSVRTESESSATASNVKQPSSTPISRREWFIKSALNSQQQSAPTYRSSSVYSTIGDIITRNPPKPLPPSPPPKKRSFNGHVWNALGPENRGYGLLQRYGWSEGQGLGVGSLRDSQIPTPSQSQSSAIPTQVESSSEGEMVSGGDSYEEPIDLTEDVVIDLTLSSDDEEAAAEDQTPDNSHRNSQTPPSSELHGRTTLLVPLPIVPKPDRLGIGLKSNPNSKDFRREKLAEKKVQVRKAERNLMLKRQSEERKRMLAYMNG